jgi:transcriptional regulator with XRE-family HTH domain
VQLSPIYVRLREAREARGWSQVKLAERAGVTRATVSRIETGKVASLDLEVFEKLADALGVHPATLIEKKE